MSNMEIVYNKQILQVQYKTWNGIKPGGIKPGLVKQSFAYKYKIQRCLLNTNDQKNLQWILMDT